MACGFLAPQDRRGGGREVGGGRDVHGSDLELDRWIEIHRDGCCGSGDGCGDDNGSCGFCAVVNGAQA